MVFRRSVQVLVTMSAICSIVCVGASTDQAPHPRVIEYKVYSHLRNWTIKKVDLPLTRCLLRSVNGTTHSVLCDRKYDGAQFREVAVGLTKYKSVVGNLDLVCVAARCVCGAVDLGEDDPAKNGTSEEQTGSAGGTPIPTVIRNVPFEYCAYPETLTRRELGGYSALRVLSVGAVGIARIERGAFDDFRRSLQVLNLTGLSLREDGLAPGLLCNATELTLLLLTDLRGPAGEFPADVFACPGGGGGVPSLQAVFANGNRFARLPPSLVGAAASSILVLNLTNNGITELSGNAFVNMTALQELDLADNALSVLPGGVFASLGSLLFLSLRNNRISVMDTALFRPLAALRELIVAGNGLHLVEGSFGVLPKLTILNVAQNELTELNGAMFAGCSSLSTLNITRNRISRIDVDAFSSLTFLRVLKLDYNQLYNSSNLKKACSGRLGFLGHFGLGHNKLTELLPRQFYSPPYASRLQILDLSFNGIQSVAEDAFRGLRRLRLVSLSFNRLKQLPPKTFSGLLQLQMLWMDNNQLSAVPDDAIPPNVVWLSLSFNEIQRFPRMATPHQSLKHVYIGYNNITELGKSTFRHVPGVTLLNFTHCNIGELEEETFGYLKDLEALDLSGNRLRLNFSKNYLGDIFKVSYLNLSHNCIRSAEDLLRHNVKYANFLDISSNPLRAFPDQPKTRSLGTANLPNRGQIGYLYVRNCGLVHVDANAFELLPNLVHLDLSDNELTHVDRLNIAQEDGGVYFVFLYGNPMHCDCRMSWLKAPPYDGFYKLSTCRVEMTKAVVPFSSMSGDQFLCSVRPSCTVQSDACRCFTDDAETDVVVYVQCPNASLSAVPRAIPASARVLDLRGNNFGAPSFGHLPARMATVRLVLKDCNVSRIVAGTFARFYQLEFLDLSSNRIADLPADAFSGLYKLKTLRLHDNDISTVEPTVFDGLLSVLTLHDNRLTEDVTMQALDGLALLRTLTLSGNPWRCGCDNATFKHWLLEKADVLEDITNIRCNDTPMILLSDDAFVCYDNVFYVREQDKRAEALVSALAASLAVMLVFSIVWYKNRKFLSVLVYYKFGWRAKRSEDEACIYDAFIAYGSGGGMFDLLITELIPRLEPSYRLFIPDRDSLPGQVRSEEVIKAIRQSRRSVFILSEEAAEDELFLFTFQTAYNHVMDSDNHHRIILMVMDEAVTKDKGRDVDTSLQAFLKAKHYIKWGDKYLWQKLLYLMPDPVNLESKKHCNRQVTNSSV